MRKLLLLIAIAGLAALYPGYVRLRQYRREAERLESRAAELRGENADLQSEVDRMHSQDVSTEHAARELGMVRNGEVIYEVVEKPEGEADE